MAIPYNNLKNKFKTLADQLITDVNISTITLYYRSPSVETINNNTFDLEPNNLDYFRGRIPSQNMVGRPNEGGQNVKEKTNDESFLARVYWRLVEDRNDNVVDVGDICKIIVPVAREQSLLNAEYAVIDGYNCRMISTPKPHGLMGNLYISSRWEVIE